MIIVPVENKPDWRHPPLVTVLLIVANVWVYFALAGADARAWQDARQAYTASDLVSREAGLFRNYSDAELPPDDHFLVDYIVADLGFDAVVAAHDGMDRAWRRDRAAFERERDRIGWIHYGLVPADAPWWSYLTSMFLHGGVDHLVGNMVFLFLFGFALERVLGAGVYAALYLLGGLAGGAVHVLVHPDSHVPTIGASGAVSALMGGYLAVYQLRRIRFFYSVLVYFGEFRAPALVILPLWLLKELYGYFYGGGNVAYWDHIGGLAAGALLGHAAALGRRVDTGYLDSGAQDDASRAALDRLDGLIDQFKYDQARQLASSHLRSHPGDVATWRKYLEMLHATPDHPDYHRAVRRVLALAGTPHRERAATLIEETYGRYVAGKHPQPALNDARLLCALGREFARRRRLDPARRIANSLLEANRREPELAGLLGALSKALTEAGSGALARHYESELSVRFPEAS